MGETKDNLKRWIFGTCILNFIEWTKIAIKVQDRRSSFDLPPIVVDRTLGKVEILSDVGEIVVWTFDIKMIRIFVAHVYLSSTILAGKSFLTSSKVTFARSKFLNRAYSSHLPPSLIITTYFCILVFIFFNLILEYKIPYCSY